MTQKRVARFSHYLRPATYHRLFHRLPKRSRKRAIRYGLLSANLLVLVIAAAFVVNGNASSNTNQLSPSAAVGDAAPLTNPLDQLSSADIAVQIARASRLEQAPAVTNKADTVNAQLAVSSEDQNVVTKPQVVTEGLKSRKDIQTYVTKEGDTIASVAAQFGVTSDTIRWSNDLTGDSVPAGKQLVISPVNGIAYIVKPGDTPDSVASKYKANKELLIAMNDAEIGGLPVGQYIIIPGGSPPTVAGRVASLANTSASGGFAWGGGAAVYGANGYDYGYCTWYAANRRAQAGRAIPSNLGNASTWKVLAQRAGLGVGNAPAAGAIIWTPPRDYYGHVGYVDSVNADGSVNVSEMNVAGWGVVSRKTLSPEQAAAYSYIY